MSKKRKKRRRRTCAYSHSTNKHHLLFQGRHWKTGYAKLLRDNFIFEVPICIHQNLHNHVIFDIPLPAGGELSRIWRDYVDESPIFFDILDGIEWLVSHSEDENFKRALEKQHDFFYSELYGQ